MNEVVVKEHELWLAFLSNFYHPHGIYIYFKTLIIHSTQWFFDTTPMGCISSMPKVPIYLVPQ